MSDFSIMAVYPPGTKMRLKDDDRDTIHEVYGYEWFAHCANIVFRDVGRLNIKRTNLIEEVLR